MYISECLLYIYGCIYSLLKTEGDFMDYLEENLKCIEKSDKILYNNIIGIINRKEYDFSKFEIIETRNGQRTIEILNDGKQERLNSLYNPIKEAEKWAEKYNFNNLDTPVIMFGIANGVFSREILKRLALESVAIFVEPDSSLFIFCLMEFDMSDIFSDERVKIFVENINMQELYHALNVHISVRMVFTQIVCIHPRMDVLYSEEVVEFLDTIKRRMRKSRRDYNTVVDLVDDSVKNTFKNLHFIKESNYITDLIGQIPVDLPCIIVAAGPSLDKNIDDLRMAEKKAFILATDRSVRTLINHNINFDAIVTLDPMKETELLDDPSCFNYPIFSHFDSKNEILEMNKGKKIWIDCSDFWAFLYKKYNIEIRYAPVGGSVATTAFNIARILGFKRVVLIGQDLAFSGDVTHAGRYMDNADINQFSIWIDGIDGKKIRSRLDWIVYLEWFEGEIKRLGDNMQVIDATEGGAKIKGTKIMKLSDVIEKYCNKQVDCRKIIEKMSPTFDNFQYQDIREDLLNFENEIKTVEECAEKGKEAAANLLKHLENKEGGSEIIYKNNQVIKEMNKLIEEQFIYNIINLYIRKDIEPVMMDINCISGDKYEDLKETCLISKFVYEKILYAAKNISPMLHDGLLNV